ncbi:MAG: hypothetical protein ACAH95_12430 [Fimbriimonas sp.]
MSSGFPVVLPVVVPVVEAVVEPVVLPVVDPVVDPPVVNPVVQDVVPELVAVDPDVGEVPVEELLPPPPQPRIKAVAIKKRAM